MTWLFIGVDLVELTRIEELAGNPAFLQRIYTEEELKLVEGVSTSRRIEILAGRFAVKEAVTKALGTGISNGITFRDVQTLRGSRGEPVVSLLGSAAKAAASLGVDEVKVSLSHAGGIAAAYVLLVTCNR